MFSCASNQIVKDLYRPPSASFRKRRRRQASKLARPSAALFHARTAEKLRTFEKNQPGRPYSAPRGGPRGVLLPFLQRGSRFFIPHTERRKQARTLSFRPSKSATSLEYQKDYSRASPVHNFFRGIEHQVPHAWPPGPVAAFPSRRTMPVCG